MLKSGIYNLIAGLTRLGVSLLSLPLLIHFLGKKSFGLFSIINSVVAFVSLAEGSVALATTVFIAKEIQQEGRLKPKYSSVADACLSATALLGIIFFVILYILSPFLANLYQEYGDINVSIIYKSLKISAILLFLRILQQYFIGVLQAHHQYGIYNSSFTIYFILSITGNVILAWLDYSIVSLFVWQTILTLFSLGFYMGLCFRRKYIFRLIPSVQLSNPILKDVLLYCCRTWPGNIGGLLFTQGDKLIVGKLLGLEMAGIYSALTNITYQINVHSATPVQPIIAYLKSDIGVSNQRSIYKKSYKTIEKSIFSNTMIVLFLGLFLIVFSNEIVIYFLRIQAVDSLNLPILLSSLALIYAIYSMNAVGYFTLFAIHKEMINTLISIGSSVITISLIYSGTILYGLTGAIWGNIGYFVSLIQLPIAFSFIGFKSKSSSRLYLVVSFMLVFAYLWVATELSLLIRIILFVSCLCIALLNARPYIGSMVSSIMNRYSQGKA